MRWLILSIVLLFPSSQEHRGWELFQNVIFTAEYFEDANSYFDIPTFNEELLAIEGQDITLKGYIIPFESDSLFMLSALPFASCFFCGGAGPETAAEIVLKNPTSKLVLDDYVTIKGKLQLNKSDINHLNFILKEAIFVENKD